MAKNIQAEMSTKIALDLVGATKSVSGLTSAVRASQSAWRSQEALLKSSGESAKAAQARYDGLGKSIEEQQKKIDLLKSKQSQLEGNTKDTAAAYLKYQNQINSATKQLSSMEAQQQRAKSAMDYQTSGLAKLQSGYREMGTASKAYVERLQAEGKTTEANKAQMDGYKSAISNLSSQLKIQESELSKVAETTGKSSSEYAKQKTRVDETATALAKTKNDMNSLNESMKKANPSIFTRLTTAVKGTNKEAEKTPSLFKKIVAGGLVTNALSAGWSKLTSVIGGTVKSGLELNEAGEEINDTWSAMGKNSNDVKILSDQMSYLRSETGATGDQIHRLQANVDTFTHGDTDATMRISAGIASVATASRIGGDGMDALGKSLNRVIATGNLTTSSLARLEKTAPTLGEQLANAAGVSQTAFSKMVSSGKVSSQDFQNLLTKIGDNSKATFDKYGKTAAGSMAQITGGWTTLKAKMMAPLFDVKTSGMASLADILQSAVVRAAATQLGKSIALIANYAKQGLDYIAAHKADVTGIASDLGGIAKIVGETVWSVFKSIIQDIGSAMGISSKNAKGLSDPLGQVHGILDKIVKNKSAIQETTKAIMAMFAVKQALNFASAIGKVGSELGKLGNGAVGNGLSGFVNGKNLAGAGQSIKSAGGVTKLSGAGLATSGIAGAGVALDAGSSIVSAFKDKSGSTKQYQDAGQGIGSAIGGGIGLYFGGPLGAALGSQIGKFIGKWGGTGAKSFMTGWNSQKKPSGSWLQGLGWDAKKVLAPISTGIGSLVKTLSPITKQISKLFSAMWSLITAAGNAGWKKLQAVFKLFSTVIPPLFKALSKVISPIWKALWNTFGTIIRADWKIISTVISSTLKVITNVIKLFTDLIKGNWSKAWRDMGNLLSSIWNGMRKTVSAVFTGIWNVIKSILSGIRSIWSSVWGAISSRFSSIWNGMKSVGSSAIGWLGSKINAGVGAIRRGWDSAWSAMSRTFGGIWGGIKSAARSGVNGVIGIINGLIGAVNWVWSKFTGHNAIKKLQRLATGGFVGKMHMVMVNDGQGPDYKELFRTPNGQYGMFQERNAVTALPEGTRVYNGKETKSIMSMAGIEHYAGGGIIGAVGNFFKGGWDKLTAIGDWLKHPIANIEKAINGAIGGMSASTAMFTDLGKGIAHSLTSGISSWMNKQLKGIEKTLQDAEGDAGGSVGNPGGSGVARWRGDVVKALKANGFSASASQVSAWLRVIARESGGNPHAINLWDSNAKKGVPSKGLVQTIGPTFNAYKFKGHNDIYNGYDDLLAGINYMKHIYGKGASAFRRVSGPEGYANGGLISGAAYRLTGEAGPEMIMPLSQAKASRAWQLLGNAVAQINSGNQTTSNVIGNESALGDKLDNIASLLQNLAFAVTVDLDGDSIAQKQAPKVKAIIDNTNRFNNYWKK